MGTWPRLDGAPTPVQPESKSYDKRRRKMAHFLGMDFLFTQREFCQTLQSDSEDRKVLVNSTKTGAILSVKRDVPEHLLTRTKYRKLKFPRNFLGITKIQERVSLLSHLVHTLTRCGIPNRSVLKSLHRLSMIWYHTKFSDMRKHVKSLTLEVRRLKDDARNPREFHRNLLSFPRFTGDKIHKSGIITPLWSWVPVAKQEH